MAQVESMSHITLCLVKPWGFVLVKISSKHQGSNKLITLGSIINSTKYCAIHHTLSQRFELTYWENGCGEAFGGKWW